LNKRGRNKKACLTKDRLKLEIYEPDGKLSISQPTAETFIHSLIPVIRKKAASVKTHGYMRLRKSKQVNPSWLLRQIM
jgi:hypothetical protein